MYVYNASQSYIHMVGDGLGATHLLFHYTQLSCSCLELSCECGVQLSCAVRFHVFVIVATVLSCECVMQLSCHVRCRVFVGVNFFEARRV